VQRQASGATATAAVAPLVDDAVTPAPGQMRLSELIGVLRGQLTELSNFDALAPGNVRWEVKTWRYTYYDQSGKRIAPASLLAEAALEMAIAFRCGYEYAIGVSDHQLYLELAARGLPAVEIFCPSIH
jgi:hypothetical protein